MNDMDPADRQIAFLKIGLYSGVVFGVALIVIAMASQKKFLLGLIIAAIFLVIVLPLDNWILRTVRRKQIRGSDLSNNRSTFSRRI